jgi:hypothetical protein
MGCEWREAQEKGRVVDELGTCLLLLTMNCYLCMSWVEAFDAQSLHSIM